MAIKVGTDVGGTFTDLVVFDDESGEMRQYKSATTPPEFAQGISDVLEKAAIKDGDVDSFTHGSTVVINALTQRSGAKTALVTTAGFRDVLELGRSNRPDLYNFRVQPPKPFVPRALRFEVDERMDFRGNVVRPFDNAGAIEIAKQLDAENIEALAICFLHSYVNPEHERACAALLAEKLPNIDITMSHEITREWREYERTSTAVLNAFVQGVTSEYLTALESRISKLGIQDAGVMQSSGGLMPFSRAKRAPINLVESGPVAGVVAAKIVGERCGFRNVVALDVGGTTAKASLIENSEVPLTTDYRLSATRKFPGYPIKVPVVDIIEIGTGGGSIASVDSGGRIAVGPRSAGAKPGPACYPKGSSEPTVTDANLITGRLEESSYAGGAISVSVARARAAMAPFARELGVSIEDAALGIIKLAGAQMGRALRLVTVERGHDPRSFAMVCSGGGGPLHASDLARQVGMETVIVPPLSSVFSAWGMLMSDTRRDWVITQVLSLDDAQEEIAETWRELERTALSEFESMGSTQEELAIVRYSEVRYTGQEHTVRVATPDPSVADQATQLSSRFAESHQRLYGFTLDVPTEVVGFHLAIVIPNSQSGAVPSATATKGDGLQPQRERLVLFDQEGQVSTPVYDKNSIRTGDRIEGPALIEEPYSTVLLQPGDSIDALEDQSLIMKVAANV